MYHQLTQKKVNYFTNSVIHVALDLLEKLRLLSGKINTKLVKAFHMNCDLFSMSVAEREPGADKLLSLW